MTSVSVGVCAHNEEDNILSCLKSISSQNVIGYDLVEIIVVSSASTDRTEEIVKGYSDEDDRVVLLTQEERKGKSSAVNLFIREARGDILVLVNADNRLRDGTLSHLLEPFSDESVGMVGGHPIPQNTKDTVVGFAVNMLWEMHHELSLKTPKTGELVAFRNTGLQIPQGVNTDEDWIRMKVEEEGMEVTYSPQAEVLNRGPATIEEFLQQRIRVNIGERYMKRRYSFHVPTWKMELLLPTLLSYMKRNRRYIGKLFGAMVLEMIARSYATLHVLLGREDPYIWKMIGSSKKLD